MSPVNYAGLALYFAVLGISMVASYYMQRSSTKRLASVFLIAITWFYILRFTVTYPSTSWYQEGLNLFDVAYADVTCQWFHDLFFCLSKKGGFLDVLTQFPRHRLFNKSHILSDAFICSLIFFQMRSKEQLEVIWGHEAGNWGYTQQLLSWAIVATVWTYEAPICYQLFGLFGAMSGSYCLIDVSTKAAAEVKPRSKIGVWRLKIGGWWRLKKADVCPNCFRPMEVPSPYWVDLTGP